MNFSVGAAVLLLRAAVPRVKFDNLFKFVLNRPIYPPLALPEILQFGTTVLMHLANFIDATLPRSPHLPHSFGSRIKMYALVKLLCLAPPC
jgi:hypothetical protein